MNTNNRVDNCINNVLNKKDKKIDTLVISGGALKGIAQLGALQYLKENQSNQGELFLQILVLHS